jgi:hypothetical protein
MWTKILIIVLIIASFWIGNTYFTPFLQDTKEHADYQAYHTKNLLDEIDVTPGQHEKFNR